MQPVLSRREEDLTKSTKKDSTKLKLIKGGLDDALIESKPITIKPKKGRPIKCKTCNHQFKLEESEKVKWEQEECKCPSCGILFCYLPPTERQLKTLQDEYFASGRDSKIMDEIYKILVGYAEHLIVKKHYQYVADRENLEYHAHCCAWYLIEHYYTNPSFKITNSFGTYLQFTMMQTVYDVEQSKVSFSLNFENPESKRVFELPDKKDYLKEIEEKKDRLNLIKYLSKFLFQIEEYSLTKGEEFNRLIALNLFLNRGEKVVDKFFQKTDRVGKPLYEKTLDVLKRELYKLHDGN